MGDDRPAQAGTAVRPTAAGAASRLAWVPVAVALAGIGWGSTQFSPMLLIYSRTLDLPTATLDALFGVYVLGMVPGLLIAGPIADARGRRPVVVAAAILSLAATAAIILGAHHLDWLFAGRLAAGVSSGMVFGAGSSWLRELSLPPFGAVGPAAAARRAAVAMTAGFGGGSLAAGVLAQWVPDPTVTAYVPHLAILILAVPALALAPETLAPAARSRPTFRPPGLRAARFRRVVAPLAPWVFAAPAIAFAFLPEILGAGRATDGLALTGAVTAVMALAGVAIQPLGRRLDLTATSRNRAAIIGLVVFCAGLCLSAVAVAVGHTWLLAPCAIVLGCAYGLCLVAGLIEVQAMASPGTLAGLTAVYYALTYIGFAAPYLLTLAHGLAGYPSLLMITAALALITAGVVSRTSGVTPAPAGLSRSPAAPQPAGR
jgi:hypothetical protein